LFHPLFLYESLWSLVAFIVLLNLFLRYRHRLLPGDLFLAYLIQYSFIRFLLEGIRVEVTLIGDLNFSQAFMGAVFVVSLVTLIYRHRRGAVNTRPEPEPTQQAAGKP
jgi:phosphatidylglycerol:prolipoprotein diacylglycerol transferase